MLAMAWLMAAPACVGSRPFQMWQLDVVAEVGVADGSGGDTGPADVPDVPVVVDVGSDTGSDVPGDAGKDDGGDAADASLKDTPGDVPMVQDGAGDLGGSDLDASSLDGSDTDSLVADVVTDAAQDAAQDGSTPGDISVDSDSSVLEVQDANLTDTPVEDAPGDIGTLSGDGGAVKDGGPTDTGTEPDTVTIVDCSEAGSDGTACDDDDDPCTADFCFSGECQHLPLSEGDSCDDGNPCTTGETCAGGACGDGTVVEGCKYCMADADCDDGLDCTTDTCLTGTCEYSNPTNCCTEGAATVVTEQECGPDPDGPAPCSVLECLPGGTCNTITTLDCCVTDADCDDGLACTVDTCAVNTCEYSNPTNCCTEGAAAAVTEQECGPDPDGPAPCFALECLSGGTCNTAVTADCCLADADCSDGDNCTDDFCEDGACTNPQVDCADGDPCTADVCFQGSCVHPAQECDVCGLLGVPCPDGFICDADVAVGTSYDAFCISDDGSQVFVPAGDFWMGCNEALDVDCSDAELPAHLVTTSAFAIDRTEVTVAAYEDCVSAGSCTAPVDASDCYSKQNWQVAGRGQHPVNCVTADQARTYCAWGGKAVGPQRLPTEAEWERAARGGCETLAGDCASGSRLYPWGDWQATCAEADMNDPADPSCAQETSAVGSRVINTSPYGCLDMAGNVFEIVQDYFSDTAYSEHPVGAWPPDPTGPLVGDVLVMRGGGTAHEHFWLRSSARAPSGGPTSDPLYRAFSMGFRCARPLETGNCADGQDNDGDGLTDCDDNACAFGPVCTVEADCGNGVDDDADGYTDCFDPGCELWPCNNGAGACDGGACVAFMHALPGGYEWEPQFPAHSSDVPEGCGGPDLPCTPDGPLFPWPPDTTQTKCYNNSMEIACPGSPGDPTCGETVDFCGQDAQYGMDVSNPSWSTGRFVSSSPGGQAIVTDSWTGLVWQASGKSSVTWYDAISECNAIGTYAGYTGWRMPDWYELLSLVDFSRLQPYSSFPGMAPQNVWSGTSLKSDPDRALFFNMYNGGHNATFKDSWSQFWRYCVSSPSPAAPPTARYFDSQQYENLMFDSRTGLLWEYDPTLGTVTWGGALQRCEALDYAGRTDWRLPTAVERASLEDPAGLWSPGPTGSWTSTTHPSLASSAWGPNLKVIPSPEPNKLLKGSVRCVTLGP